VSLSGGAGTDPSMRLSKPLLDLLRYWRSRELNYHQYYGPPLVIVGVLLIAAFHWWSLLVIVPLLAIVVYLFHWEDVFGGHS
jgi:hypothetical protein